MYFLSSGRQGRGNGGNGTGGGCGQTGAALLLLPFCLLALIATVASVPTSVLAQNTELTSNANNLNANKKTFVQQQLSKVKRSSNNNNNNINENIFGSNEIGSSSPSSSSTTAPNNNLDKKSSPEIVPSSFSNLPPVAKPILNTNNNNNNNNNNQPQAGLYALPSNSEIMAAVEAAAVAANNQQPSQSQQYYGDADELDNMPVSMHKRGISTQQYLYDAGLGNGGYLGNPTNADYYANPYAQNGYEIGVPSGVWNDELESYGDLQEQDDFAPMQRVGGTVSGNNNRNKAYDNLQNLLNTEAYLESVPLSVPLQYANRNYGILDAERNKRGGYYNPAGSTSLTYGGNLNKYNSYGDIRPHKRDNTKLTPADMLALVALVEAGERARKETDADAGYAYPGDNYAPKSYTPAAGTVYDYGAGSAAAAAAAAADDIDYNAGGAGTATGNWLDAPAVVDYYGMPVNVESAVPKYDFMPREHKYGNGNRYGGSSKRFMVAKKKRSVAKYFNNGEKYY